jgi:hypothetical protein
MSEKKMIHTKQQPFTDPRTLMKSASLQDPVWALIDSLDAVTHGLENPDAEELLENNTEEAYLAWRHLIKALKYFYSGRKNECLEILAKIDKSSPLFILRHLFLHWAGIQKLSESGLSEQVIQVLSSLYTKLIVTTHPLVTKMEQAEEALRQDMIEIFIKEARKILLTLLNSNEREKIIIAFRYARSILENIYDMGLDINLVDDLIFSVFSQRDAWVIKCLFSRQRIPAVSETYFKALLESPDSGYCTTYSLLDISQLKEHCVATELTSYCNHIESSYVQLELFNGI